MNLDEIYPERYEQFLNRLREARLEAGLTQEEAAKLLGKPQYFVSRSETGERRVDIVELEAFAAIYLKPIAFFSPGLSDNRIT